MAFCLGDDAYFHLTSMEFGSVYHYPVNFDITRNSDIESLKPNEGMHDLIYENLDKAASNGYENKYDYVLADYSNYMIALIELKQLIQIYKEKPELAKIITSKIDMPWRPLLAEILKALHCKKQRVDALDKFYSSYSYYLGK